MRGNSAVLENETSRPSSSIMLGSFGAVNKTFTLFASCSTNQYGNFRRCDDDKLLRLESFSEDGPAGRIRFCIRPWSSALSRAPTAYRSRAKRSRSRKRG